MRLPVALTGTPGVGKSAAATALGSRWRTAEVSDLALRLHAGRRRGRSVEVDVPRLREALRKDRAREPVDLIVGHLAHLLPVREAIVLRCRPNVLARRLARSGRGSPSDRAANALAEALDLVLVEALRERLPVYEIDTTRLSARRVAREVARRLRHGGPPRSGVVDWLGDASVTEHLLEGSR